MQRYVTTTTLRYGKPDGEVVIFEEGKLVDLSNIPEDVVATWFSNGSIVAVGHPMDPTNEPEETPKPADQDFGSPPGSNLPPRVVSEMIVSDEYAEQAPGGAESLQLAGDAPNQVVREAAVSQEQAQETATEASTEPEKEEETSPSPTGPSAGSLIP